MEVVSYIAYATLVVMAIAWTVVARKEQGIAIPGLLRAVYFVSAAALIPVFGINMGHSLWLAPFGCFFARMIAPRLVKIPVISAPFTVIACTFERIVHMGMPRHKIEAAQLAAKQAAGDAYCSINGK